MRYVPFCEDPGILSTISLVKTMIDYLSIIVPIALIVMITIEISKIVFDPDEKLTRQVYKSITGKMMATAAIFFIPMLVTVLMTMIDSNFENSSCWNNASKAGLEEFRVKYELIKSQNMQDILDEKGAAAEAREKLLAEREKARAEAEKRAGSTDVSFGVRTVPPTPSDHYFATYRGRISQCPWYAISRAMEIVAASSLPEAEKQRRINSLNNTHGDGGRVYGLMDGSIFSKGQVPKAPAVLSYMYNTYGHVVILEKIEDGKATITHGWNRAGIGAPNVWSNVGWAIETMSLAELESKWGGFQGYAAILE